MKTFFLFLSVFSDDPSRPTTTKEIRSNLTIEQCAAEALIGRETMRRYRPMARGTFICEPMVQHG